PRRTRLRLERDTAAPPIGTHSGYTVREMADIVRRVLEDIGIGDRLSALVLILGHGSSSLNNPHESAHDCGACGGGRGGPNARAFTRMANDVRVRARLRGEGLDVPPLTVFVAAYHDSCTDAVALYDLDDVPATHRADLAHLRAVLERARERNAHERCRRFESAPLSLSPQP